MGEMHSITVLMYLYKLRTKNICHSDPSFLDKSLINSSSIPEVVA